MAVRPEVLAQLARMLGDDALRAASDDEAQAAVEQRFQDLVASLVAETAGSDAVFDHASAVSYLESRLRDLAAMLSTDQIDRIRTATAAAIDSW